MPKISIQQAVKDIRDGKMVILVDDEDRENEGDLTCVSVSLTLMNVPPLTVFGAHEHKVAFGTFSSLD